MTTSDNPAAGAETQNFFVFREPSGKLAQKVESPSTENPLTISTGKKKGRIAAALESRKNFEFHQSSSSRSVAQATLSKVTPKITS